MLRAILGKSAAARFCRHCGYEFARGSTDECPMCARFEQSRTEFTVPRPSELAGRQTRSEERPDINNPVASADRLATALEHPVVFAAQRARTASADGRSGGPTATAIRTPALQQLSSSRVGARAAPAGQSPTPPEGSTAWAKDRPAPPPTRESAPSLPAPGEENTALPAPDAHRVIGAPAVPHHAASSSGRALSETAIWVLVGVMSALISASVPLLLYLIR